MSWIVWCSALAAPLLEALVRVAEETYWDTAPIRERPYEVGLAELGLLTSERMLEVYKSARLPETLSHCGNAHRAPPLPSLPLRSELSSVSAVEDGVFAWLFGELLLYGAAFICGIVTAALVTVTQGDFEGGCILYGEGSWNVTGRALGVASFGSSTHCNFVDFVSLLVAIYCFCTVFYFIYTICLEETARGSRWLKACLVVSIIFLFLLLVCGCLIRVGFSTFCQSVVKEAQIKSCSEAEKVKWTPPFHGTSFNQNFSSAETATWVNFFLWVVILSLLAVQWRKGSSIRLLSGTDPEWSTEASGPVSETERLIASQPRP
ncbi:transmembrane protein 179B-like [Hypanus sabinus]|uniref:transmembrane protein 179B-like n=1 Tax=Hypanus sabinus TaxID=79690 RepID=UPI0028C3A394|nr:transmembrane protein 179B-like [Hypanus sabinus]